MEDPGNDSRSPFARDARRNWARLLAAFEIRARFWDLLDLLETRRRLRIGILLTIVLGGAAGVAIAWFYPSWREENALQMVRQWLDAGKLDQADEAMQVALNTAPDRWEAWSLAARVSLQSGRPNQALVYARHAASMNSQDAQLALDWATAALAASQPADAVSALAQADALGVGETPLAHRLKGELARTNGDLAQAREQFEAALRTEPGTAINEVPLAVILLSTGDPADRARAESLLSKWNDDPRWGAEVLRQQLEEAFADDRRPDMIRLAGLLRSHPAHTRVDALNCLLALAAADESLFAEALQNEETSVAGDPGAISGLISWLAGNGRGEEAYRWGMSLPEQTRTRPPVVVTLADTMRVLGRWDDLRKWTASGDWQNVEFLRQAMSALAARQLGDSQRYQSLWQGIVANAQINGGRAFFLAGVVYTWGWTEQAIQLWEVVSRQGGLAMSAYGALARHYQLVGDAAGLFRAFRGLYGLRSSDPAIANNYAYLAALNGSDLMRAERIARENFERNPENLAYRSTYAFVLNKTGRNAQAIALLEPVGAALAAHPGLASTWGIVLADAGRRAEAARVLSIVDGTTLSDAEQRLVQAALRN